MTDHTRSRIALHCRRFAGDERGTVLIEGIIMLPIMIWCLIATYVFFDAFRARSINIRAAYTISDMLSRETGYITDDYLDSMEQLQDFLVEGLNPSDLRVTVFSYDADSDSYSVNWSKGRGGMNPISTSQLADLRHHLPVMPDGENAIMVQTIVGYQPRYAVGLPEQDFDDLVVIRPRFAGQLCWNSVEGGNYTTATC
ncbi:MAG: hypothetical protein JKX69_03950 [Rhodobacteraceae bacterium]|nr:hypothetical protein [Paracoccaceae bacterium]